MTPRIFIGSSVEGKAIADAIQQNLNRDAFCTVWTQGIFGLGQTTIESLLGAVSNNDFGVFVLSPDDVVNIRKDSFTATRDNVLFELALFIGRYGRDRAFMVKPMNVKDFHIPTDLLAVTPAEYEPSHFDHNPVAALGTASNEIRAAIRASQSYNRNLTFNVSIRTGKQFPLKVWLDIRNLTGVDAVIKSDHFLCNGLLRPARKLKVVRAQESTRLNSRKGTLLSCSMLSLLTGAILKLGFHLMRPIRKRKSKLL